MKCTLILRFHTIFRGPKLIETPPQCRVAGCLFANLAPVQIVYNYVYDVCTSRTPQLLFKHMTNHHSHIRQNNIELGNCLKTDFCFVVIVSSQPNQCTQLKIQQDMNRSSGYVTSVSLKLFLDSNPLQVYNYTGCFIIVDLADFPLSSHWKSARKTETPCITLETGDLGEELRNQNFCKAFMI